MIDLLSNAHAIFTFYIIRHLPVIVILVILMDYILKRRSLKFSYAFIRYTILINWGFNLVLLAFTLASYSQFINRATGAYWWAYSIMLISSFLLPVLLIHKKWGRNKWVLLCLGICCNIGSTFEIYVILITSIHQGFLNNIGVLRYLKALFLPPFIIVCFLVGIEFIFFQQNKIQPDPSKENDHILDE